jgi:putative Holliday junction resolvase
MPATPEAGQPASALVFDHGGRRIGVALALPVVGTATPITTLAARAGVPDWPVVDRLVTEWQPAALVVGVPYHAAGAAPGTSEAAALAFAAALAERYRLPVTRIDETLSSAEATDRLRAQRQSGVRRQRVRTADVDAMAACVIAESWLKTLDPAGQPGSRQTRSRDP